MLVRWEMYLSIYLLYRRAPAPLTPLLTYADVCLQGFDDDDDDDDEDEEDEKDTRKVSPKKTK